MAMEQTITNHLRILGHKDLGVTELRLFAPYPMVAYADNPDDFVRLCHRMEGKTSGIYVGIQPRPLQLFDMAPNVWRPARSGPACNCACDKYIEFVTTLFFDIDVVSHQRTKGHPACDDELTLSLHAAQLLRRQEGLTDFSTICCSGNGHYVVTPVVPILVNDGELAVKLRNFCQQAADQVAGRIQGVKFDPVFNLSRVMRVMGTTNRKGQSLPKRPHRRAQFVTEPIFDRSVALHHIILNTDTEESSSTAGSLPEGIRGDLKKLEGCQFIRWCRKNPEQVSEPLWWAMITNLAYLEGGPQLIHEISRLDTRRYDYHDTQRVIERVITAGYKPVLCKTLVSEAERCSERGGFQCYKIRQCPAKAPMYRAISHTVYQR